MILFAAVLIPSVARAATVNVSLFNAFFTPNVVQVAAGDTVTWTWKQGTHNVTQYPAGDFTSNDRTTPATFSYAFPGGTARYRCTIHSTVDAGNVCSGMCGVLTDQQDLDVLPPAVAISAPRSNDVVIPLPEVSTSGVAYPVPIRGSASDNVAVAGVSVRLYDGAGRNLGITIATCEGCNTRTASWSVTKTLLPGQFVAEATAIDTAGLFSPAYRVSFFVV